MTNLTNSFEFFMISDLVDLNKSFNSVFVDDCYLIRLYKYSSLSPLLAFIFTFYISKNAKNYN